MIKFRYPQNASCQMCISYIGARFAVVLVLGILIGTVAMQFVEFPPSSTLLKSVVEQQENTKKISNIENRTTKLEGDVKDIKEHINLK